MRLRMMVGRVLVLALSGGVAARAQDAKGIVAQMVANEDAAAMRKPHSFYVSTERSERTGGHSWKERVAETSAGKIRFLIAEDGHALSPEREGAERGRLAAIVANPQAFLDSERAKKSDESKAKAMLDLLPRAFVLENMRREGSSIRIDFRPDPAYATRSMEEKVLHGMAGTMEIEAGAMRLREISASLPQDVTVGFGLATVKAGSSFKTTRTMAAPDDWKTQTLDTDIHGKAVLFKSLGKNEHAEHGGFKLLPFDMTVAQAVEMVEQE